MEVKHCDNSGVSIIMPVYNCQDFVVAAIESVISQTYAHWELIVIDDGSTDSSGQICDYYSSIDDRIKVFHTANEGLSCARNYGLEHATFEYICFLDSDDLILPDALQTACDNKKNFDLLIWGYETFPNRQMQRVPQAGCLSSIDELVEAYPFLDANNLFNFAWNKLYRRSIIVKNRLSFIPGLTPGEDLMFNLAYVSVSNSTKLIPDVLYRYRYRVNADSLSSRYRKEQMQIQRTLKEETDKVFGYDESVVARTRISYLNYAIWHIKSCLNSNALTKREKINEIKRCVNDEFFIANLNLVDSNQLNGNKLIKKLIKLRQARAIYYLFYCKKYYKKLKFWMKR